MQVVEAKYSLKDIMPNCDFFKKSDEPILLNDGIFSAVVLSEKAWRDIEETLYLVSIPGMRESLINGKNKPLSDCSNSLDW